MRHDEPSHVLLVEADKRYAARLAERLRIIFPDSDISVAHNADATALWIEAYPKGLIMNADGVSMIADAIMVSHREDIAQVMGEQKKMQSELKSINARLDEGADKFDRFEMQLNDPRHGITVSIERLDLAVNGDGANVKGIRDNVNRIQSQMWILIAMLGAVGAAGLSFMFAILQTVITRGL